MLFHSQSLRRDIYILFRVIYFTLIPIEGATPSTSAEMESSDTQDIQDMEVEPPTASTSQQEAIESPDYLMSAEDEGFLPLSRPPSPVPPMCLESTIQPPPSYSIIFDNLDFHVTTHHQSTDQSNKSIHWTHLMAVEDRVPTHHLSNDKPPQSVALKEYDIMNSLPDHNTQYNMRREFVVLGARMLTEYLDAFKPLADTVIHHIPHEHSENMTKASTDVSAV